VSKSTYRYALRVPSDLARQLRDLAEKNRRSMNKEITVAIEDWIVRNLSFTYNLHL